MNIVLYRYLPRQYHSDSGLHHLSEHDQVVINGMNEALQRQQRRAGLTFVSRTKLDCTCDGNTVPLVALRAVLANPLTTEEDLESVLDEQIRLADVLEPENEFYSTALVTCTCRCSRVSVVPILRALTGARWRLNNRRSKDPALAIFARTYSSG